MRCGVVRLRGEVAKWSVNSASLIFCQSIASGLIIGAKCGLVARGALALYGQQLWHSSQPNIQPCRGVELSCRFSIVARDMHRRVSICLSWMAWFGHASMQRRHSPQPMPTYGVS
jgi:hypothetical protein